MATGNINMIINGDKRKQQATIKVKESKEFMNIMNLVFNRSEEMSSGLYLELQNSFMELYNMELMSDILVQSNKTIRNQNKTNMSMEQKRQALRNGATHMIMCNNCSRVVCKSFLTEHLSSSICKDNKKIIEAAGKDTLNTNFNEEVLCKYITPTQSS